MKKIKKITALVLLAIMAIPHVMLNTVHASTQPAVPNFNIRWNSGGNNANSLTLSWGKISPRTLDEADTANGADTTHNAMFRDHGANAYSLEYKDVSRSAASAWQALPEPPAYPSPDAATTYTFNFETDKGILYSFRNVPSHDHATAAPGGGTAWSPVTPADSDIKEALFVSDIEVEARGRNDELTVTWDSPTYGSTQAFPIYNIYYARTGNAKQTVPIAVTTAECVNIPADSGTKKGPRLSYTIKDPSKIFTGEYHIVIEPCNAAGKEVRTLVPTGTPTITIGGVTYPVAFTGALYETRGTVELNVSLVNYGRDIVNLFWGDLTGLGNVTEIAVFSATTEADLLSTLDRYINETIKPSPLISLSGDNSMYSQYYRLPQPVDSITFYGIVVTVNATTEIKYPSNAVIYIPSSYEITPNTPDIHMPLIGKSNNTQIELWWDAFLRESYFTGDTVAELKIGSTTFSYDTSVTYDLYVVDNLDTLLLGGIIPETISSLSLGAAEAHAKTAGGASVPAYTYTVASYIGSDGLRKAFEKNKLYYIKLVARKDAETASEPAYATFYIPVEGEISSPPMLRKPPLEVRKYNGSDVVTPSTIDVTWLEEWSEVYDYSRDLAAYDPAHTNPAPEWQTRAAVVNDYIYYGDDAREYADYAVSFHSELKLDTVRSLLGIQSAVPARTLSIKNSSYEAKVMLYDSFITAVDSAGSFNKYLEDLMKEPLGTNGWSSYTLKRLDEGNNVVPPYITVSGLNENTTYAILVRPYRVVNGETLLGYANFIAASTAPTIGPLPIKPTAPVVEAVSWTDTKATIRWKNVDTLSYEVVYSDVFLADIENQYESGTLISIEDVGSLSIVKTENNTVYRYIDIEGLFPDTEYYFWVRAHPKTGEQSDWSNPAYVKTSPLRIPTPPGAFGIASANYVGLINKQDGTDFTPKNKNYLIMEWLKDELDPVTTGTGESTEVADILSEPNIVESYIAKFNDLVSNKTYYFRAKTILTATMDENGVTTEEYSYLIQISSEPDFIEMKQIYVPKEPVPTEPYRQTESVWTATIYYKTSTSGDDYDTDFDPDLVPLPDEDFEITYNGAFQQLTYRFRASGKDEKGNYDNRVDQRFISTLVSGNVHNYNIDLSKYEEYTIKKRVVEVPYTLLKTFAERKITFGIRAGDVTLLLPPDSMETALVKNIPDYGDKARLQVIFDENPASKPILGAKDTYAGTPQNVSLFVQTATQYTKMPYTGSPLGVRLKVASRSDLMDANLGAYVSNEQTSGWSKVASTYDKENGQLEFKSQPGMYAILSKGAPDVVSFDQTTTSMLNVASSIAVTDMVVYNGNQPATSNQMLNLMDAVVNGKSEVALNKVPDASVVSTLQKAGMNIGPDAAVVSREQAIAAMVRLYELKSKKQIKPTYTLANTPYSDTANAHPTYQPSMLKAAEIDMLNGKTALRPKDALTLGELFELADVIIADTGM